MGEIAKPGPSAGPTSKKTGLLLLNLGTPQSPTPRAVRRFLRQFLLDPRVIDLPRLQRELIVRGFVLWRRPKPVAAAYAQIWTAQGSPILVHGEALVRKVQARISPQVRVALAMRYGEPSIDRVLDQLLAQGIDQIVALPLFPQSAAATTGSVVQALYAAAQKRSSPPLLHVVPPFFDHQAFVSAWAERARPLLNDFAAQRLIFSFHGLPERQIKKSDPSGAHCLTHDSCCDELNASNRQCYRAQCFATARLIADALKLPREKRIVSFQSRFGRSRWIGPFTEETLVSLGRQGIRNIAVLSPSFVADCLETLHELGHQGRQLFLQNGGKKMLVIPSLNDSDDWADAIVTLLTCSERTFRSF